MTTKSQGVSHTTGHFIGQLSNRQQWEKNNNSIQMCRIHVKNIQINIQISVLRFSCAKLSKESLGKYTDTADK